MCLFGAALLGLASCQGPAGPTPFVYGEALACSVDAGPQSGLVSLQSSLDPLRESFDRFADMPRVVALIPHMGCEKGAEILRREVLDAYPTDDLRLFVIWQDVAHTPGSAAAAARASLHLRDARVLAFHDCEGRAGRAFARGNLPVAEAREVFLFYPSGVTWPREGRAGAGTSAADEQHVASSTPGATGRRASRASHGISETTPRTEDWVHHLGRVTPERFCTPEELPREMRETVGRLIAQARSSQETAPR